jgi:hypothetical protein
MSSDELTDFIDGADELELLSLQQFSAQEGLTTVRALLAWRTRQFTRIGLLRICESVNKF